MKKLITIIGALLGIGCASTVNNAENSLELEQTVAEDTSQTRFRIGRVYPDTFRVLHTEDEDGAKTLVGANVPVDSPFYKGKIVVCTQSTPDNDAVGVNFDGKVAALGDLIVGGAFERDAQTAETANLASGYVGKEYGNGLIWKLGIADIEGDKEYTAFASRLNNRDLAGAGLTVDGEGEGKLTVVSGRVYDGNRGNGFGYRAWASTDFDQGHTVDAVFSTNTTFSRGSLHAPIDIQDGMHDPKIIPNVMDFVPGDPTHIEERAGPGGVAVRARYKHTDAGEEGLVGVRYNLPNSEGGEQALFGLDVGQNSPDSGDDVRHATAMAGMRWKHMRLDYSCKAQDNAKPTHTGRITVRYDF